MARIYDITHSLRNGLTVWPKDTPVLIERLREAGKGSRSTVSRLSLSSHAGTHVDAPCHFVPGRDTVDALDLNVLVGDALVVEIDGPEISDGVLEALSLPAGVERIIFKTANSSRFSGVEAFFDDYVGVTKSGAEWLLARGVRLVGLDYLSIAAYPEILEVHQLLLGRDVVLLETLDLRQVPAGRYQLVCLPLKLAGVDGAPTRAVLFAK